MILSDLAKYSMTRSVSQSLCDSWASCFSYGAVIGKLTSTVYEFFYASYIYLVNRITVISGISDTAR